MKWNWKYAIPGVGQVMAGADLLKEQTIDKRKAAEADIAERTAGIESGIAGMADYQIAPEIKQQLEMLQQSGQEMKGLAGEATDLARARTGMAEAPGEALARKDIQQAGAQTTQNIMQAGGGGAAALGALAQAGLGQQQAFGQLAQQRAQFRSQAEADLANSLRQQAGMTQAAAGLEAQGLSAMAGERGKQFEYGRDKELTGLQFGIDQLAGVRAEEQARRARNAQIAGSVIGTVGSLGKTALTGGLG